MTSHKFIDQYVRRQLATVKQGLRSVSVLLQLATQYWYSGISGHLSGVEGHVSRQYQYSQGPGRADVPSTGASGGFRKVRLLDSFMGWLRFTELSGKEA
jgi:hypothetical protein